MKKYFVCIAVVFAVMAFSAIPAFCQDSQTPAKDDTAPAQETQAPAAQAPAAQAPAASAPAAQAPAVQAPVAPAPVAQTPAVQAPAAQAPVVQAPAAEAPTKANELSIYGEVQAINLQAASLSVQYYDYDNDEEKTLEVSLDKDSKLENVKAIEEIKKGDWVDVTYTVTGSKNTAKLVSVEAEEPAAENNAPTGTAEE